MRESSEKERNNRKDLLKHYMEILARKLLIILDDNLKVYVANNSITYAVEIIHEEISGAVCIIVPKYIVKGGLMVEIFTGMKTPDRNFEAIQFLFREGGIENEERLQDLSDLINEILQRKIFYFSCDIFDDDALQESERDIQ